MQKPKPIKGFKKYFNRRRPSISEVVREPTAGGVVWRHSKDGKKIEILLFQDARDRWSIPKGHIEEGENAKQTAEREIMEETGLKELKMMGWLGKVNFRFRRQNSLVLMSTQVYLVKALGDTDALKKEEWMNGIAWMSANDALEAIEYEDIGTLILLGLKRIRDEKA